MQGLREREGAAAVAEQNLGAPLARVRLQAPIPRPARNIFCLGRNYAAHAAERVNMYSASIRSTRSLGNHPSFGSPLASWRVMAA